MSTWKTTEISNSNNLCSKNLKVVNMLAEESFFESPWMNPNVEE